MTGKIGTILLSLAAGLCLVSQSALAESSAVKEMAQIVMNLNHHPSDEDKETLRGIVSDDAATPGERVIANALLQMDHQVSSGDKAKLGDLKGSSAASAGEKELADVLMGLNHKASSQDKERLGKL